MKGKMALLAATAVAFACGATTPRIEQGELKYDVLTHKMSIDYVLVDSAAIVTFDLQTNVVENGEATSKWLSIGAENYQSVSGNFNRVVMDVGVKKTISWTPYEDWPQKVKAGLLRAVVTAWSTNSPPDYCVVNINRLDTRSGTGIENRVRYYLSEKHLPYGGLDNSMYWTSNMVMRRVHAAGRTFRMGSPWTELGGRGSYNYRSPNEMSVVVTFTKDYWMAIFPMTCAQTYYAFNSRGNHSSNGDKGPMTGHSWASFRIGLSGSANSSYNSTDYDWPNNTANPHLIGENSYFGKMKTNTGLEFDFPTEAQWEFACRAGTDTMYYDGKKDFFAAATNDIYMAELGWFKKNCSGVQPVMGFPPNPWGFYDMHGNVYEFCLDHYPTATTAYTSSGSYNIRTPGYYIDYGGPSTGPTKDYNNVTGYYRVAKGGKYASESYACRSASRMGIGDASLGNTGENAARPVAALTFHW